ncbi:MATE family efflux transporter [uncultured Parasutterella sp.]|uniref:MATE family efflux transporter n=1 Tax=uncultured Parasutterella sp. TaxID=1263098 RepID=UPI0025B76812|nr:MATE family efflux transporter [uncultured Parasutterella sp.]
MALATALANVLASSILFFKLTRSDGPLHIELHRIFKPDGQSARMIVRIGWPAGLQSSVFSLSNLIIQSAINSLGPEVMAASVAAFTIEINVYGFVNAFGLAATTFISQNYGAGNVDRCKRITWISMGLNIGFTLVGVFTQSEDIIALGMIRLWWVVVPEPLNAVMEVFSDAMRGYGYSLAPAIITVIVICSVRVIWVYTAFAMKPTYEVLMMVYPLSWLITSIGLGILYFWFEKNRLPKLKAE